MRIVFFGTPEFADASLRALLRAGHEVVGVVTQPDRPQGRSRSAFVSPPVKTTAADAHLPVLQPERPVGDLFLAALRRLEPDLGVVVAYGHILRREVLAVPRRGLVNVHASLLPRLRGAAPIQWAIANGESETGVSIMQMDAGMDSGPVYMRVRTPIAPDDTGGSLHDRLAELGAQVLAEGLQRASRGERLTTTPQSSEGVTYAHKLDKAEAKLDFTRSAAELERKVRAFDPWPVAEAEIAGERVRIWQAKSWDQVPRTGDQQPGGIIAASKHGIDIACGEGVLRILKLQRAGGRVISAADYLNARPELKTR